MEKYISITGIFFSLMKIKIIRHREKTQEFLNKVMNEPRKETRLRK